MKHLLLPLFMVLAHSLAAQEMLGLVGGWKMDSNCQLVDLSDESPAHGALIDVTLTANRDNVPGSALSFSQNTSYITLGVVEKLKLPNDKTISFWIRPVPVGANRTGSIFWYGTGIDIRYEENASVPRLVVRFGNTTYFTRNLTANQWQHVTITFQKNFNSGLSKAFYYVDGDLVQEETKSKSAQDFTNAIAIIGPQSQTTLTNGFRGSLDELKIFNRTLTSAEVQNLVLPVTLEYFRAKKLGRTIELSWKTQLEDNVSHFELQRSADGMSFSNISSVTAGRFSYLAYDASIIARAWYRLKVVDLDGKTTFSNVVRVNSDENTGEMKVFPNPVTGKLQLVGASGYGKITVMNNMGIMVKQVSLTNNLVDVSDLRPGLYYINFFDGNKKVSSKFTKL